MQLLAIALLIGVVAAWRPGGPLLAMMIAWLICVAPVAAGLIVYDYLASNDTLYLWLIAGSIAAFALGALLAIARQPYRLANSSAAFDWEADFARWLPMAQVARVIGIVAALLLLADALSSGRLTMDLASLRSQVVEASEASWLGRFASIAVWACFFCFAFTIYFRHLLTRGQIVSFLIASIGIVLTALTSAGRQAVFQVILLTLILEMLRNRRLPAKGSYSRRLVRFLVVILGTSYLAFVTMTRSSGIAGYNKSELFLFFFAAHLNPGFESILYSISDGLRDTAVELLIYSTHTIAMFSLFSKIDFGGHYWGMIDFPFIFRQIEPIIGYRVMDAFDLKSFYLKADAVIGVGWTTTFSSLMMDFGSFGGCVFLFFQGYLGQRANISVGNGAGFGISLVLALFIMAAIYLPYLPLFSDTNMLFLLLIVGFIAWRHRTRTDAPGARPAEWVA